MGAMTNPLDTNPEFKALVAHSYIRINDAVVCDLIDAGVDPGVAYESTSMEFITAEDLAF